MVCIVLLRPKKYCPAKKNILRLWLITVIISNVNGHTIILGD
jgi:hypothetical protein